MQSKPTTFCPNCNGTGQIPDNRKIGLELRLLRVEAQLSLRQVATRMGISAPYLTDLELGRRGWDNPKIDLYKKVIHENWKGAQ